MIGDDGSTAIDGHGPPGAPRGLADEGRDQRRLAGARRARDPDECARAGHRVERAQGRLRRAAVRFSTAVSSRASARRSPPTRRVGPARARRGVGRRRPAHA